MTMICSLCDRSGIRWMGPLSALTHTECPHCGGQNCQHAEEEDGRCPQCGEDEMDGGRCYYCGFHTYNCGLCDECLAPASGTEARRAETSQSGSVHDGPAPKEDAQ